MFSFSDTSFNKLITCNQKIQLISNEAIKITDFTVVTGHRSEYEQNKLYPRYTKVKWPDSKHNSMPSGAIDIAPYIKPYGVIFGNEQQIKEIMQMTGKNRKEVEHFVVKSYARLIGIFEGIAFKHNIRLRVGMDWDNDYDTLDQTFHDLGHIEVL